MSDPLSDDMDHEWPRCMDCGHVGPPYAGDCDRCGEPVMPPVQTPGGTA